MNLFWRLKSNSFIYSRKRKEATRSILASSFSIIIALIVSILVATALGYKPWIIVEKLFTIGFEDPSYLFYKFGVYALAGFAFYFAWKSGVINIGISGQMLAAGTIVVILTNLISRSAGNGIPEWIGYGIGQLFIIIIAIAISSSIAMFVGLMQNYLKINAVVSSILLNWIIYFISFFVLATYFTDAEQFANSSSIPDQFRLYDMNGSGAIIPVVIITFVIGIVIFIVFKFTVFGHKIKCVGLSAEASRFVGYNIKRINLLAFAISGAIAGVLATVCYSSTIPAAVPLSLYYDSVPLEGFEGIMISLVGCNNPFGIMAVSILFGLFESSMSGLPTDPSFNDVIVGLVMLGSSLSVIVIKWRPFIKLNTYKYDIDYHSTQINFDNSIDSLLSKYSSIHNNIMYEFKENKKDRREKINTIKLEHDDNKKSLDRWYSKQKVNLDNKYDLEANNLHEVYCYKFEENYSKYAKNNSSYDEYFVNMMRISESYRNQRFILEQNYKRQYRELNMDYDSIMANVNEEYKLKVNRIRCDYNIHKQELKISTRIRCKEALVKFEKEKANLIDLYNFNKIKNLISKKLYTKDIIEQKTAKINSSYDNTLTKYVNNLKEKEENAARFERLRAIAVKKSTSWKNKKVEKMILKQNKIISNTELFVEEVNRIRTLSYDKLIDHKYIDEVNKLINNAIKCQKGENS